MIEIVTTNIFDAWFESLRDMQAKRRIQARIDRMESGNFGDSEPVGEGISEARIHCGAGYRVYFMQRGKAVVVLLCGGDKSSQKRDIARAKQILKELED
jgi:putative addiction module killer protein